MNPAQAIAKKRDGRQLTDAEIAAFINGYVNGEIADYQMSALAMAITIRGMDVDETTALTRHMLNSGTTLQWSSPALKVDKHSTGGIGDKVSIVLAPLLACCGLQVPMISGRGLGATGGTLDKLESIPRFRTDLSTSELCRIAEDVGCVITGTTGDLAPADQQLYALRDVTGTVPSVPLITASILSKKLAENLDALVLDVKFGSGAFMKSIDRVRELARSLVDVGQRMGVKTTAVLTDMNQPLGRMVGNAVEVDESIDALAGDGPDDLRSLVFEFASELLISTGVVETADQALEQLSDHIASGRAMEKFEQMVAAQSGDFTAQRHIAPTHELSADRAGFVSSIDAERLGLAVIELGGGRRVMTDKIDHSVGLEMLVRIGDAIQRDQPIVRVFASDRGFVGVSSLLKSAIVINDQPPAAMPLIAERVAIE